MDIHNLVGALALAVLFAGCVTDSTKKDSTAENYLLSNPKNFVAPVVPPTPVAPPAPAAPPSVAPPPPAPPAASTVATDAANKTQPKATPASIAQIVRYIGADSSNWQTTPSAPSYADLYTRVELFGPQSAGASTSPPTQAAPPALRDYYSEDDGWVKRVFISTSDSVTTLVDVSISDPALTVAIPLFSITHSSGLSLGNVWTTNFTSSNIESPLFRIGPNTGITVHLHTKVSQDLKSQGASMAIGAITSAIQIAAPSSPLLTTLSKSDATNKASAIDQAISNLISHDITEDIELGRLADSWAQGDYLKLTGCAPFIHTESKPGSMPCAQNMDIGYVSDTKVGEWSLQLSCPRISVFDARSICNENLIKLVSKSVGGTTGQATGSTTGGTTSSKAADTSTVLDVSNLNNMNAARKIIADSASDAQILSFNLSSQVNVESFVQSQSWYTTFIGKGVGQGTTTQTDATATTNQAGTAPAATTHAATAHAAAAPAAHAAAASAAPAATQAGPTAADYANFCTSAMLGLETNGLNKFDSALVLRSVIRNLPQVAVLSANFGTGKPGDHCATLLANAQAPL